MKRKMRRAAARKQAKIDEKLVAAIPSDDMNKIMSALGLAPSTPPEALKPIITTFSDGTFVDREREQT